MKSLVLHRLTLLSSMALLMLASCTDQSNAKSSVQPTGAIAAHPGNTESNSSTSEAAHATQVQPTDLAESPAIAPEKALEQNSTTSTGNLLSPEQVAKLTQLPIPIVAPTYLPKGFRLVSADGGSEKYANGEDDAGYMIEYQGDDNTCFSIYSSKDGPRRLKQIGQVESAVGLIKMYEETYEGKSSIESFIPVKGNPMMLSPVSHLNPATGNYERCKALDRTEYERILKSVELVKE